MEACTQESSEEAPIRGKQLLLNLIFAKVIESKEHSPAVSDLLGSLHWFMAGMLQNRLDRTQ